MNAEILKGHLDLLLLSVLEPQPAHGYAIADLLRGKTANAFDLPEGTLYPALHRLERAGWLASRWDEQGGRRRRVYQLTPKGRRSLADRETEWRTFSRAMQAVVGGRA